MSLTASNLLERIKNKYGQDSEGKDCIRDDKFMRKLCEAVVEEIQDKAVVSFTNVTTVVSPTGACTGTLQNGKIN